MRINSKIIAIFNLLVLGLLLLPLRQLDLFCENYSTLSLKTEGYLYLLFLGVMCGILCGYETMKIHSARNGIIVFFSLLSGVLIPHHVPYDLQGNLHLLLAYLSASVFTAMTFLNIQKDMRHPLLYGILMLGACAAAVSYMQAMMVNCLSELVLMSVLLFINFYLYIQKEKRSV